jgi:hypothetical protein
MATTTIGSILFPERQRSSSASQVLRAKLERDEFLLEIARKRDELTAEEHLIIKLCQQQLDKARECITRMRRQPFLFWELVHQVDEMLLLVLPRDLLLTEMLEIQERFERKVKDPFLRQFWLGTKDIPGLLREAVERISGSPPWRRDEASLSWPEAARCHLYEDRRVLQAALRILNKQVDSGFWQLSKDVSIQVVSGLLLLGLFALTLLFPSGRDFFLRGEAERLPLLFLILLGAGGAILSNMLTKGSFIVSIGATSRYFVYYVLVKPIVGAFAALFFYLLERSTLLFAVVRRTAESSTSVFQIVVDSVTAEAFVLAVLAVAAGFSAERLLGATIDKVLCRIFKQSEKEASTVSEATPKEEERETSA